MKHWTASTHILHPATNIQDKSSQSSPPGREHRVVHTPEQCWPDHQEDWDPDQLQHTDTPPPGTRHTRDTDCWYTRLCSALEILQPLHTHLWSLHWKQFWFEFMTVSTQSMIPEQSAESIEEEKQFTVGIIATSCLTEFCIRNLEIFVFNIVRNILLISPDYSPTEHDPAGHSLREWSQSICSDQLMRRWEKQSTQLEPTFLLNCV